MIGEAPKRRGKRFVRVICDCGTEKEIYSYSLTCGDTASCGCYQRELRQTHGMSSHPIYGVWRNMRYRGQPYHLEYENYGGRGIRVAERWRRGFEAFYADMRARWQSGLSIERVDNNGNYEPGNSAGHAAGAGT